MTNILSAIIWEYSGYKYYCSLYTDDVCGEIEDIVFSDQNCDICINLDSTVSSWELAYEPPVELQLLKANKTEFIHQVGSHASAVQYSVYQSGSRLVKVNDSSADATVDVNHLGEEGNVNCLTLNE